MNCNLWLLANWPGRAWIALAGLLLTVVAASAAIGYDAAANRIWVTDAPAGLPCTPARLLAMDRLCGWQCVSYDAASDTYTLKSDLWIGNNDGTETYFQLGSPEHPRETLLIQGHLVIYPALIKGENPDEALSRGESPINRLTAGQATNAAITPTIRIFSETNHPHTVLVGAIPLASNQVNNNTRGGELHLHHATLTAAIQDPDHALGLRGQGIVYGVYFKEGGTILNHATLSWINGAITGPGKSRDCIFDHCTIAAINGRQEHTGTIFRNLGTAIMDYGCLEAYCTDCTFTNNQCNWMLNYGEKGLTAVDCTIAPPLKSDSYTCRIDSATRQKVYPVFTSRRHVLVEVADPAGAPVTNAVVSVCCEQDRTDLANRFKTNTDKAGRTPGKDGRAILLTELTRRATDTPNQPATKTYTYAISVTAPGFAATTLTNVAPAQSWQVIKVILNK